MSDIKQEIASRVKDMREVCEISIQDMAEKLDVPVETYSKYETGENDIPTAILIKLSRFYNTSIDYLLGETDDPKRYR